MSFVRSLDIGPKDSIEDVKFSKDGKYLAVGHGFERKWLTTIYDVQGGEKTWLVCDEFLSPDNADQLC